MTSNLINIFYLSASLYHPTQIFADTTTSIYINHFFGNNFSFPKLQIGGSEENIKLKQYQINKLKIIYKIDIDIFNKFNRK